MYTIVIRFAITFFKNKVLHASDLTGASSGSTSIGVVHAIFVCVWRESHQWARASSFTRFLDHTQRHTTFGRIPLDE